MLYIEISILEAAAKQLSCLAYRVLGKDHKGAACLLNKVECKISN